MNFYIKATSLAGNDGSLSIKKSTFDFGTTESTKDALPNPSELFLGAFASCILKNVERFSGLMKFEYDHASIYVTAIRKEHPPMLDEIRYELEIVSDDPKLNLELLKKNIERFGTIYNTVKRSSSISGAMVKIESVSQ